MIKLISTIIILLSLTGCNEVKLNTVSYLYAKCESNGNVGIKLDNDGVYRCIEPKHKVKQIFRTVPKVKKITKYTFKNPSWLNVAPIKKCDTTVTNVYKDGSVRCKGQILDGQKSRIVYVNK